MDMDQPDSPQHASKRPKSRQGGESDEKMSLDEGKLGAGALAGPVEGCNGLETHA